MTRLLLDRFKNHTELSCSHLAVFSEGLLESLKHKQVEDVEAFVLLGFTLGSLCYWKTFPSSMLFDVIFASAGVLERSIRNSKKLLCGLFVGWHIGMRGILWFDDLDSWQLESIGCDVLIADPLRPRGFAGDQGSCDVRSSCKGLSPR